MLDGFGHWWALNRDAENEALRAARIETTKQSVGRMSGE